MKIVINKCYGGFGISKKADALYRSKKAIPEDFDLSEVFRNDTTLIEVVEELGEEANGVFTELAIVEIPDDIEWQIEEYDGIEWVAEKHRTWS